MSKEYAKSFYTSKEWIKCRDGYIKTVYGLCERCGKPGKIVHHKKYITQDNINDPDITLNFDNLEYLCLDCHNKEHEFEREKKRVTREGLVFDPNGDLVELPPKNKSGGL
ncbi:HNH endonuclease signature motif containing protein [Clostridium sp. BJN0001]|uniref:HNH endonuclease signature motif containing protein n=1 Tax=Clostridium sp. BJN0001 TaxID=2930219 RepID=UPI001FD094C2|nr:HNH endonuclease signature motif containing protein [Clostridium sp. BJN0001]